MKYWPQIHTYPEDWNEGDATISNWLDKRQEVSKKAIERFLLEEQERERKKAEKKLKKQQANDARRNQINSCINKKIS